MDKICSVCKKEKPTSDFYSFYKKGKEYFTRCKQCQKELSIKYYKDNLEQERDRSRKYTKTENGKINSLKHTYLSIKRYPEKYKAHYIVSYEIQKGSLKKQPCEVCGEIIVQAHHDDYSKPLEVRWLCPKHHRMLHKIQKYEIISLQKEK